MAPNNPMPCHGNEKTMNLNHLILTNIQSSPYFKVNLYELKTYHEVIDEIYYKVDHLEPWEKGSRKTAGQTGMCGGVRGVGAGGIVSSSFCLLYKLFTLKLTRKQVIGLCSHTDSPYIRALGFMYIRYTQPPADMWEWYREYLEDDEEIDVKAGGGHTMMMGEMLRQWMTKLEWYGTLFPRIPVPIQKILENQLLGHDAQKGIVAKPAAEQPEQRADPDQQSGWGEAGRISRLRESPSGRESTERKGASSRASPPFDIAKEIEREKERQKGQRSRSKERQSRRSPNHDRKHRRSRSRERRRSKSRERKRSKSRERKRSRSRDRKKRSRSRERKRSRSRDRDRKRRSTSRDKDKKKYSSAKSRDKTKYRHRSRSRERPSHRRENSFERDLRKEQSRIGREQNGD